MLMNLDPVVAPPAALLAACAASLRAAAAAQRRTVMPPPQDVLNLTATASVEVHQGRARDHASRPRATAPTPLRCRAQLKQALDAALAEARKAAQAGRSSRCSTGNFSLYPRYGNKGRHHRLAGHGRAGGRGHATWRRIAQLAGRIPTHDDRARRLSRCRARRARRSRPTSPRRRSRDFRAKAGELRQAVRLRRLHGARGQRAAPPSRGERPRPMMRGRMAAMAGGGRRSRCPVEAGKADACSVNVSRAARRARWRASSRCSRANATAPPSRRRRSMPRRARCRRPASRGTPPARRVARAW